MDKKVLVIYDIADDKRRRRVNKAILGFGIRIQESAFECVIDSYEYTRLVSLLERLIDTDTDIMKIYRFGSDTETKSYGEYIEPDDDEFYVV